MSNRISKEELIQVYGIEIRFFEQLETCGILHIETDNNTKYLSHDDLTLFEKMVNWHYDLEVNFPGLEVIHHLLSQIEQLQVENRKLAQNHRRKSHNWEDSE